MTEPDNIILVYLRRLTEQNEAIREDIRDLKFRVSMVEQKIGVLEQQMAGVLLRLDRVETRLDRIERRMDLVEA